MPRIPKSSSISDFHLVKGILHVPQQKNTQITNYWQENLRISAFFSLEKPVVSREDGAISCLTQALRWNYDLAASLPFPQTILGQHLDELSLLLLITNELYESSRYCGTNKSWNEACRSAEVSYHYKLLH